MFGRTSLDQFAEAVAERVHIGPECGIELAEKHADR
jgi:hypothetical protein